VLAGEKSVRKACTPVNQEIQISRQLSVLNHSILRNVTGELFLFSKTFFSRQEIGWRDESSLHRMTCAQSGKDAGFTQKEKSWT
jgi:hypothetical protein